MLCYPFWSLFYLSAGYERMTGYAARVVVFISTWGTGDEMAIAISVHAVGVGISSNIT